MSNHYVNTTAPKKAKAKTSTQVTSQTQAIPGRAAEMARNNAGGVVFKLDNWSTLDRFLILGSEKPSYYATAQKITKDATGNLIKCIKEDGVRVVNRIIEISDSGRAPKNDPAVFALAMCTIHGDAETIAHAYENLSKVCRIGTHLFQFVEAINELGKWNAAAKRGIAKWYTARNDNSLATQMLKYQQRDGWHHRDVLRLAHVKPQSDTQSAMFRYSVKGAEGVVDQVSNLPHLVLAVEELKYATDRKKVIQLINDNRSISWEMIPTEWQKDPQVMAALLPNMGMTAMIRKLGQLTSLGLTSGDSLNTILSKLSSEDEIKNSRVHPILILNAIKQYSKGRGDKGSLTWSPSKDVKKTLNDAFYNAFDFIETTGEGYFLGIDCSGSMFGAQVVGANNLTSAEVAAVMALAVAKREPNYYLMGFGDRSMGQLKITPNMDLDQALNIMRPFKWGRTDCSLPMEDALRLKMEGINKFCVYTDNETYAGRRQPVQALAEYRQKHVSDAKLIVCGTSVTNFTIADPKDPGMMDIVGFDSAAPALIQGF
jgi:60 kDa SS-A/Ro ribonucleoprotein